MYKLLCKKFFTNRPPFQKFNGLSPKRSGQEKPKSICIQHYSLLPRKCHLTNKNVHILAN